MAALPPPWSKDLSSNDVQHCPSSPQRTARRNTEVVKVVDSSLRRLISAQGAFNRRRTMSKPYIEQIEESESFYSGIEEGLCEADQKPDAKLDFDSIPIRRTRIATFSFHLVTAILVTTFAYRLGTTQAAKVAFIGGAASLFFATLLLLIQYHNLTERRHMFFRNHAIKSSAIVSSLFPERVQGRLLENSMATLENDSSNHRGDKDVASVLQERNSEKAREPPKNRLMQFLRESSPDPKLVEELTPKESKPIADYFPNCTVMFGDIAGFTAWSSSREPTQVFTLLQDIYKEFDKVARKRRVFKVETIGDCYVAVTGLPEVQEHHAVLMAAFALECRKLMRDVCRRLEPVLGPDTGDLSMRIGLHSGPVTAGVLRGEKSRFQLFGDTVNTAARMESNGERNRIHISQKTADLLVDAGKGAWLTERPEKVNCKGKGMMQTFWFEPKAQKRAARRMSVGSAFHEFTGAKLSEGTTLRAVEVKIDRDVMLQPETRTQSLPSGDLIKRSDSIIWGSGDKCSVSEITNPCQKDFESNITGRLIEWNCNVLLRLLKKVVAYRDSDSSLQKGAPGSSLKLMSSNDVAFLAANTCNISAIIPEEVRDMISFRSFHPHERSSIEMDSIDLGDKVDRQIKAFVKSIASLYRSNPFHNYEHACHVQLSTMKLLERAATAEAADTLFCVASDPLTQFVLVLSGLIHNVDHTGVSNSQLVKENAAIANAYGGKNVAEQNSVDLGWSTLMNPDFEALRTCIFTNDVEFTHVRQLLVNAVIATDIFDEDQAHRRIERFQQLFEGYPQGMCSDEYSKRKASIMIEHLMQASDVAHTMQDFQVYLKWSGHLFHEALLSFKSGRTEIDPSKHWYYEELAFFDQHVIPLAEKLKISGIFGIAGDECLCIALDNRSRWEAEGEQIVVERFSTFDHKSEECKGYE